MSCRWGVVGCANIAQKVVRCIVRAENARLVAVASRSKAKAEEWLKKLKLSETEAVEGYEALLSRTDIDAVYMPLPTALHLEWAVKAADAGKHILLEKPVALNSSELTQILGACQRNNVQFMDGVMFMHHRRLAAIEDAIRGDPYGSFGEVQRVTSSFSFSGSDSFFADNVRISKNGDPLGCLGDLGWYCIRFGLFAFGYDTSPLSVTARKIRDASEFGGDDGVPVDMSVTVYYDEAKTRVLEFHCSFCHPYRQWVEVVGSQRTLRLKDFVIASRPHAAEFTIEHNAGVMELDCYVQTVEDVITTFDCTQELEMIKRFSSIILSGQREAFWPRVALLTQLVTDGALRSANEGGKEVAITIPPQT